MSPPPSPSDAVPVGAERARAELVPPVRRAFEWLLSLREVDGRIVCREHRVEHTGKSAGAIVMALELARDTEGVGREDLVEVALQQGRRLTQNLVREGTSPCFTFRPGRHDPFNCSNSVIDGGACSDALAALVRGLDGERDEEELAPLREASLRHARTYLRYAVLDKGVPAQRAWGLTGLASAWRLEQDPVLEEAALEAVKILAAIQNPDGSYPYHPLEWGAEHPGASDVSAFYQSRITAFLIHAIETLGRDPRAPEFRPQIERGLEFLSALHSPGGIKTGLVEAKPWYWGATYEVASHPFDVFALSAGARLFREPRYARLALAAHARWAEHLDEAGAPRSHLAGPGRGRSYQCPVFWAGHAMWTARALDDLAQASVQAPEPTGSGRTIVVETDHFPQSSLVRLEDECIVAWVRGARPGVNVNHGSPHGAGLLRVVRKSDGRELLPRCRLGGHQAAEWSGLAGLPSPGRGWRAGAKEVRFSAWIARVHWRAGRRLLALRTPLASLRRGVLAFAHARVSSAFALSPKLEVRMGSVDIEGPLAWRDGTPVPGTSLARSFRVDGGGLIVSERVLGADGVRALDYPVPEAATEVRRNGHEVQYRLA
jgi:hypothetical protein